MYTRKAYFYICEELRNYRTRRFQIIVISLALLLGLTLFILLFLSDNVIYIKQEKGKNNKIFLKYGDSFHVDTEGCQMPDPPIYSPLIVDYISKPSPVICRVGNSTTSLVESDDKFIWVREEALESYEIANISQARCCFRRLHGSGQGYDQQCTPFWGIREVPHEFILVNCTFEGRTIYMDFHAFVPIKEDVDSSCNQSQNVKADKINVLILGMNSVSRHQLQRAMPKTVGYLTSTLNAVQISGYNVIGLESFKNTAPLLTGLSLEEVEQTCMINVDQYADSCPFIWADFKQSGYRTAFVEDSIEQSIFKNRVGFKNPPTDYFLKPFYYSSQAKFNGDNMVVKDYCIGARLLYQSLLDYIFKFVKSMQSRPYFGFFWECSFTSKAINYPFLIDDSYFHLLRNLSQQQNFNNTLLIFVSDHGFQGSSLQSTYEGVMESRQPFMYLALPEWFRDKYPKAVENLKLNSHRLVTTFDLHETLKDVLDHSIKLENKSMESREKILNTFKIPRGISLFLPIPENRTCSKAFINKYACTCHIQRKKQSNGTGMKYLGQFVVDYINEHIKVDSRCHKLFLNKVLEVSEGHILGKIDLSIDETLKFKKTSLRLQVHNKYLDYRIKIETVPGFAVFETTIRNINDEVVTNIADAFNIVGKVKRINSYLNESLCTVDYKIQPYCFCYDK